MGTETLAIHENRHQVISAQIPLYQFPELLGSAPDKPPGYAALPDPKRLRNRRRRPLILPGADPIHHPTQHRIIDHLRILQGVVGF